MIVGIKDVCNKHTGRSALYEGQRSASSRRNVSRHMLPFDYVMLWPPDLPVSYVWQVRQLVHVSTRCTR